MSIDYLSVCLAVPPAQAKTMTDALAPRQRCGAIVGPNEETFIEAWTGKCQIDLNALTKLYDGQLPSIAYWEGAAVELTMEWLEPCANVESVVLTNRTPALSGLDRVLALPFGFDLLRGHGIAHLPRKSLDRVKLQLTRLWKHLEGKDRATETLETYLRGNANEGAAARIVELLERTLNEAKERDLDLVLLSAIMH